MHESGTCYSCITGKVTGTRQYLSSARRNGKSLSATVRWKAKAYSEVVGSII